MKKKILIVGDSYASPSPGYHDWTKRAFPDFKRRENIAMGGTGFWRTVDNLHHVKNWKEFSHCIVFWSEHVRTYVRSTNQFVGGKAQGLHEASRDPNPWVTMGHRDPKPESKTKGKHIFNAPINKVRLVQKNVAKSYELGITDREFEGLKAYCCLQYFFNVFYKKYPKVNFINIHCFPWLEEVAKSFDVDVNFKSSRNVIHVEGHMYRDFSTQDEDLNDRNHMTDEQHTKFAKFISQIIDRLDNGDEITRNPDLRKIK